MAEPIVSLKSLIPGISALDNIVSDAIKSVYNDVNSSTEKYRKSFDLMGRFRKRHANRIATSLSTIQILGMTGAQKLTDIYVPSRLSPRIARNLFISDEMISDLASFKAAAAETEVNIFEILRDTKNLLILGAAGSGKTTFISALTLGHLDGCDYVSDRLHERLFPICFTLREFGAPQDKLVDMIKSYVAGLEEIEAWPFIERMMRNGKLLLVLDGLDEIPSEDQEKWRQATKDFEISFPEVKMLVTCRSGSLDVDFNNFSHLEVLPFTNNEIEKFVNGWFTSNHERGAQLIQAIKLNQRVHDLTSTPLLLSLLCNLYNNDLEISNNRTELYSRCIEVMLIKWDTSRGFKRKTAYPTLTNTRRKRVFEEIAYRLSLGVLGVMKHEHLTELVAKYIEKFDLEMADANKILSELETHHGILVRLSANYWSFSHISFQDFFCAEYIKDKKEEESYLRNWWMAPRKSETLIFLGTLLEDATSYVELLAELSRVSGISTYPALSRRLRGMALLTRILSQGVSLSKDMRDIAITQIIEGVIYTCSRLEHTGLNLFSRIVNGEPKLAFTFYKRRATYSDIQIALQKCIFELSHCNYEPLLELMRTAVKNGLNNNAKLVLASCFFYRDRKLMVEVYKTIETNVDTRVYLGNISQTLKNLE